MELRERARKLRKNMTSSERVLWTQLRKRQVEGRVFRRQFIMGQRIFDFACPSAALVIEVDGPSPAENDCSDAMKDLFCRGQSYEILRFTDVEVMTDLDCVVEQIREAVRRGIRRTVRRHRAA